MCALFATFDRFGGCCLLQQVDKIPMCTWKRGKAVNQRSLRSEKRRAIVFSGSGFFSWGGSGGFLAREERHEKDCGFGRFEEAGFLDSIGEDGGAEGSVWDVRFDGLLGGSKGCI